MSFSSRELHRKCRERNFKATKYQQSYSMMAKPARFSPETIRIILDHMEQHKGQNGGYITDFDATIVDLAETIEERTDERFTPRQLTDKIRKFGGMCDPKLSLKDTLLHGPTSLPQTALAKFYNGPQMGKSIPPAMGRHYVQEKR